MMVFNLQTLQLAVIRRFHIPFKSSLGVAAAVHLIFPKESFYATHTR
jgi:hypothetical protein